MHICYISLSNSIYPYKDLQAPTSSIPQTLFKHNDPEGTELSPLKSKILRLQPGSHKDSSRVNFPMQCCQHAQPYFGDYLMIWGDNSFFVPLSTLMYILIVATRVPITLD